MCEQVNCPETQFHHLKNGGITPNFAVEAHSQPSGLLSSVNRCEGSMRKLSGLVCPGEWAVGPISPSTHAHTHRAHSFKEGTTEVCDLPLPEKGASNKQSHCPPRGTEAPTLDRTPAAQRQAPMVGQTEARACRKARPLPQAEQEDGQGPCLLCTQKYRLLSGPAPPSFQPTPELGEIRAIPAPFWP